MRKILLLILIISIPIFNSCSNEIISTDTLNEGKENYASRSGIPPTTVGQVQIGTQLWKTKNLNVSHYRNGDLIPQVQDPNSFTATTTGAWCYYDNNSANGVIHGKLYNWYAVNDPRGLAPRGWHIPSQQEWSVLDNYLGHFHTAMAMRSTTGWTFFNTYASATNSSGFSCFPSGGRFYEQPTPSYDAYFGDICFFWTSSNSNTEFRAAVYRFIDSEDDYLWSETGRYDTGMSVRCLSD